MSICILAGTPGGPSVAVGQLLAAAKAFGGLIGGIIDFAAQLIQGAAGQVPADSIVLLNTNIVEHHREHEYDGPTYLWTKHTIRLTAIYNPLLNSWNQNNPQALPSARAGFKGPVTDVTLRHYLAQPRRNLQLYIGGQLYFQSPRAGTTVDAQNGPMPRVNNIRLISGTKTFLVDLTFETCLNESYLFTNKPTVMLSHTYSSEHDVDQDFYTTRVIHGHAFFDTSRLVQLGARADDFRAYLFHGISPGFHRVSIQAQVDEGGGELLYTIVDREITHSLGNYARSRNVTRIQCTHNSSNQTPSVWAATIGMVGTTLQGAPSPTGIFNAVAGLVPIGTQDVVCKVWGNNNATRQQLREIALMIIEWRFRNVPANTAGQYVSWLDDVKGMWVQGTCRMQHAAFLEVLKSGFFAGIFDAVTFGVFKEATAPGEPIKGMPIPPGAAKMADGRIVELSEDATPGFDIWSKAPRSIVGPPAVGPLADMSATDQNARGTYIESLVSSALLAPNTAPPQPGNTPYAKHREPPDGVAVANVPVFP